jgi:hypothetical protein
VPLVHAGNPGWGQRAAEEMFRQSNVEVITYFLPNGSRNPYIIEFQCTIETSAFADNLEWYWD